MKHATKLTVGDLYAVHTGGYAGEMWMYVCAEHNDVCFLAIPVMENRKAPKISFDYARNNDIIKFVERVPEDIAKISVAQYNHNEKSNNRHVQSVSPDVAHSKEPSFRRRSRED